MIARLVGLLVVLVGLAGCAYLGIDQMIREQRVGGIPAVGLVLLVVPLLLVGWLAVLLGKRFIGRWQHDFLDRHKGERRLAGLGVAIVVGGLLYGGVTLFVPSRHPDSALLVSLKPACAGSAVIGAGGAHIAGAAKSHLVVLDSNGNEHRWTGAPPIEWKPASLADTELVACITAQDQMQLIETCHYINGPAIQRYSATRHVVVVEPGSGRTVAEYDVTDVPRDCHMTEERDVVELDGSVAWDAVQARLAAQAGCCAPAPTASPTRATEPPGVVITSPPYETQPPVPTPVQPPTEAPAP